MEGSEPEHCRLYKTCIFILNRNKKVFILTSVKSRMLRIFCGNKRGQVGGNDSNSGEKR